MTALLLALVLQVPDSGATLDLLETRARSVGTVHAEFDLERLPQFTSIVVDFDPAGHRLCWVLGRGPGKPASHYLVDQLQRSMWSDGETGTTTDFRRYWGGFDQGFNSILVSLLPERALLSKESPGSWGLGLGINLEGKPSKEGRGFFQFYGTYYRVPFRWLGLLRQESNPGLLISDRNCTFLLPARRKTVVVDRDTGFLRSIETEDYDGTRRSLKCRSVVLNEPLPSLPKPPACRVQPVSRQELEDILESRRHLFSDLLGAVLEQWDRVVDTGRQGAVGKAYAQELSDLTSTWWEVRVHQMAAAGIQNRLDSGVSWQAIKAGEERELEAFLGAVQEHCQMERALLKASIEDFECSLEALYREKAPKRTADPDRFRALLRASFRFDEVWNQLVEPAGKRTKDAYREELDHAREI